MKTLSGIFTLVLAITLAWASFAPQQISAASLVGGCTGLGGNCYESRIINCHQLSSDCCDNMSASVCPRDPGWGRYCQNYGYGCVGGPNCNVYNEECQ